jgi:hypothetical protein
MCINHEYRPDQLEGRQVQLLDHGNRSRGLVLKATASKRRPDKLISITVRIVEVGTGAMSRKRKETIRVDEWHVHGLGHFQGNCKHPLRLLFDPQLPAQQANAQLKLVPKHAAA